MHAYKNDNGMIDIFHGEPDETITVEEFEMRKAENERKIKIQEYLAALRELGVNIDVAIEKAAPVEETKPEVAEVPLETAPATCKARRW